MKILKPVLLIIALGILLFFASSVFKVISKFEKLGNIRTMEDSTHLNFSNFLAKNLRTSNMDTIKLSGKTVINFWASWCQPCISEQPGLELLASSHPEIKFIQLSFDNEAAQLKVIESLKWKLPAYKLQDSLHFSSPDLLPMTLFMKDSIVVKQLFGKQDWQDSAISKLISAL